MARHLEPNALAAIGSLPEDTIQWGIAAGLRLRMGQHSIARLSLGNATGVTVLVTPLDDAECRALHVDAGGVFVSVEGWGAYPMQPTGLLESGYLASKLVRGNTCDGAALALLLGVVLDREAYINCDCTRHVQAGVAGRVAARD